jgi:hypothetical protein
LNSATHFFPSRSLRFTDTNFGIICNGYIHLGLFGSATWKAEEDPVRVREGGADELYADPHTVKEAQGDYGGEEQGSGRGRNFCDGRDTTKLRVSPVLLDTAIQGLTSLASQLVVALNVRDHGYALRLLGSIWQITMKSIQQNGGVKG